MTSPLRMTRARRIALAIGVPIALPVIGWTGFNAVALAGVGSVPVRYAIPVQHGRLSLYLGGGVSLSLRPAAPGAAARLTGTARYSLVRPHLAKYQAAGLTHVSYHCPVPAGDCSLDATLAVPRQATGVSLSTRGGDLSVTGVIGNLTLSSGGGNLTARGLGGTVRFSTRGGNVTGSALAAPDVTARSGGGNIRLVFTRPPDNLKITTRGGDVTVVLPPGGTRYVIATITNSGQISTGSVPVSARSQHAITVHTGGGNISITQAK